MFKDVFHEIPFQFDSYKKRFELKTTKLNEKHKLTVCSVAALGFFLVPGKNSDNNGPPDRWSRWTTRRGLPMINCRGSDHEGHQKPRFSPPDMWCFAREFFEPSPPKKRPWYLRGGNFEIYEKDNLNRMMFFFSDATFWGTISGFDEPSQCFNCLGNNIPLESCGSWQFEIVVL